MKKFSNIRVAIVGRPDLTTNYEKAIQYFQVQTYTGLSLGNLKDCDALILPGGGDITPAFFGENNCGSKDIDTELDILQIQALDFFVKHRKPILGICKGMQLINVFFGGSIIQHLPTADSHAYNNGDRIHISKASPNSILHKLYGEYFTINSAHHQGVGKTGKNLTVTQIANDNVIEGIEHISLPIIGVQWHPERLMEQSSKKTTVNGSLIFQEFLSWLK